MPERGDLIKCEWYDISESAVGDPTTGHPEIRVSYGIYWAQEMRNGVETLVTTTTVDKDGPDQSGYCAYPVGCVKSLTVVKKCARKRTRRTKRANPPTEPLS